MAIFLTSTGHSQDAPDVPKEISVISCVSKHVVNGAFSVRVYLREEGGFSGFVSTIRGWRPYREYFAGDLVMIDRPHRSGDKCLFTMTDSKTAPGTAVIFGAPGEGLLVLLKGHKLPENPESPAWLNCRFNRKFVKSLGCG